MNPKINQLTSVLLWLCVLFCGFRAIGQGDTSTIKGQVALGVSSPSSGGFVDGFEGKSVNFPSVGLGFQYMFKPRLGGKLDYNFSRISNASSSQGFKLNYSRVNVQLVYDASRLISFSQRMGTFFHAGPGLSFVKPLGNFGANKTTFFNTMGGVELHYGISDTLTVYLDGSYVFGFAKDFSPVSDGFGSFKGNLLAITFGVSISLSGCYYCGD